MSPDPHGWQPFDPDGDPLPPSLADERGEDGEVVVLVGVEDELDPDSWARKAATALARRWASSTERLFLMDLDLEEPELHTILGLENGEGATDLFLFGASVQRVAQPVDGGAFYFAPAGTATADPEKVVESDRWDHLIQGFRDAGARLLLYFPRTLPGAARLLERADRVVVLGRGEGVDDERLSGIEGVETIFLRPPDPEDPLPVEGGTEATATPDDEVVEISDLTPDDEVVDVADLAPDEEIVDIADLAPDRAAAERPSTPEEPQRVEGGRDEPASEQVVSIATLAPDESVVDEPDPGPSGAVSEVVDIADLAPEESPPDDSAAAPDRAAAEVVDIDDLAPDEGRDESGPATEEVPPEAEAPSEDDTSLGPESSRETGMSPEPGPSPEAAVPPEPGEPEELSEPSEPEVPAESESLLEPEEPSEPEESSEPAAASEVDGASEPHQPVAGFGEEEEEEEPTQETADAEPDADEFADFDLGSLDAPAEGTEHGKTDEEVDLAPDVEDEVGEFEPPEQPTGTAEESDFDGPAELEDEDTGEVLDEEGEALDATGFGDFSDEAEEGTSAEEPTEEEEEAPDFGDFSGELDEETPTEEPTEEEEEALGFGDFSGELEEEAPPEDSTEEEEEALGFDDFGGQLEEEATEDVEADEGDSGVDLEPSFAEKSGGPAEPDDTATEDFGDDLVTGPDFGGGAPEEETGWEAEDTSVEEDPSRGETRDRAPAPTGGRDAEAGPAQRGADEVSEEKEEDGEKPDEPERDRASGRSVRLALLLLLVLAVAAAGHWFGIVRVPGLNQALTAFLGPAGTGPAPVVETTDPSPTTPVLGYSLAVDAYRDARSADEVSSALRERLPNRLFVVAPVQANGEVIYRLLAGPARTAEEAGALREPLAAVLTRENPDDWTVRPTPLAFVLEETSSLQSARSRASTLMEQGISAYVLQVAYPDDTVRYRVYAGAYETPEEARAMRGILAQAGMSDVRFTERRGRRPE